MKRRCWNQYCSYGQNLFVKFIDDSMVAPSTSHLLHSLLKPVRLACCRQVSLKEFKFVVKNIVKWIRMIAVNYYRFWSSRPEFAYKTLLFLERGAKNAPQVKMCHDCDLGDPQSTPSNHHLLRFKRRPKVECDYQQFRNINWLRINTSANMVIFIR